MPRKPISEETRRKQSEAAKNRRLNNPEGEARRLAALREAKLKEDPSYRGDPARRRAVSEAMKKRWAEGAFDPKTRAEKAAATRAAWTPEQKAEDTRKRSEGVKANWAAGVYDDVVFRPNIRPRVSQHEYALAPYLAKLGYRHNHDVHTFIGRKVPDFVDIKGRRVFEYFGSFWHPDRGEEQRLTEYYASMGWTCEVLWEDDLFKWLASHQELVSEEEHQFAWKAAHVNNGYRKPELVTT